MSTSEENEGLLEKYHVERRNDPEAKHADCRYFVLDPQHDPIARAALSLYAQVAQAQGYVSLAEDLRQWLRSVEKEEAK